MADQPSPSPILSAYQVEVDGAPRHIICFLDAEDAKTRGIDPRAIVGEFQPGPDGDFDPATFNLYPDFITALTGYMNAQAGSSPMLIEEARSNAGGWLYLLDPRYTPGESDEPPPSELVGAYQVDDAGTIIPDSFRYNDKHTWFDLSSGISGVLGDRAFYDWLQSEAQST